MNPMARSRRRHDALSRLAAAEEQFLAREFLAPMLRGGEVHVRIAGIVCRLRVETTDFEGWGVFRPTSAKAARLVRPARLTERQRYLELFPRLPLILCRRENEQWLALPAHQADRRFRFEGLVPVHLLEEAQLFETIQARFDGGRCWFQEIDGRRDPATAAYLRRALQEMVPPDRLPRSGLTAEERHAYAQSYWPRYHAEEEARRDRDEERLRAALAQAGAELKEYAGQGDVYRVTYEVDGQRHVSVVARHDLTVQVAGICLSGQDDHFDLQSLVGVLREAEGGVARVGAENHGMPEEQYWQVHPGRQR
jgi:hypothetical protein